MDRPTPAIATITVLNIEPTQTLFLASIALLAVLAIARPHWLLRPFFAFACLMSIVINPAAAFVMKPGYPDSPLFDSLRLSSVIFPLGVVVWVACTPFLSTIARRIGVSRRDGFPGRGIPDWDRLLRSASTSTISRWIRTSPGIYANHVVNAKVPLHPAPPPRTGWTVRRSRRKALSP